MAEEKKPEEKAPEKSEQEQNQDAFTEELSRVTGKEEKKPEPKEEPKPDSPEKAPEKEPEKAPSASVHETEKAQEKKDDAPVLSDDDKALLSAYDFAEADANPKLLSALRRAETDKHGLRSERDRWGNQNKELSGKLKAFAKQESTNIDAVKDKIKTRLSKIPKDKLSEHARALLDDPAYLEAQAAIEVARMTEEAPETENAAPEGHPDKAKLAEAATQVFDEVKKIHPDITEIYSKPEFYQWIKTQDRAVQQKYFEYNSAAHVDLANRYKAYQTASKAAEAITADTDNGADAFAGHGATGSQRKGPEKELTPEEAFEDELSKAFVKK